MLEIRHLKTLLALREHGSLVAAASDLCLTPSAISHQLKELDHWFGVEVVNRRSRPVTFSTVGQRLLKLVVRKKDYLFDGKPIETTNAPFITDKGELYLVFRTRSIALKPDGNGEWQSPAGQGYLTRQ